jgi:hypothetical protein
LSVIASLRGSSIVAVAVPDADADVALALEELDVARDVALAFWLTMTAWVLVDVATAAPVAVNVSATAAAVGRASPAMRRRGFAGALLDARWRATYGRAGTGRPHGRRHGSHEASVT